MHNNGSRLVIDRRPFPVPAGAEFVIFASNPPVAAAAERGVEKRVFSSGFNAKAEICG